MRILLELLSNCKKIIIIIKNFWDLVFGQLNNGKLEFNVKYRDIGHYLNRDFGELLTEVRKYSC